MTDPNQIESEIAELAIVEKSHVNNPSGEPHNIFVAFESVSIPDSFNREMLSSGYAIYKTHGDLGSESAATYRNITDFGGA